MGGAKETHWSDGCKNVCMDSVKMERSTECRCCQSSEQKAGDRRKRVSKAERKGKQMRTGGRGG